MKNIWVVILLFGILAGQIIKFPQTTQGGITILDLVVITLIAYGFVKVKIKLLPPPKWVKAALVFFAVSLISLVFTPLKLNPEQYLISVAYPIRFISYFLFAWLLVSKTYPNFFQYISKILVFSGIGLAVLGLMQLIFLPNLGFLAPLGWDPHYLRTVSTFLDPNFLGAYLVLTLITILQASPFLTSKQKIICFSLTYLALITTFSRGSYLMFLVGFLALTILQKSFKTAAITFLLLLGLLSSYLLYHRQVEKPRNIDRVQSAQYRIDSWQMGLQIFMKYPSLGVGYNSYRYALKQLNLAPDNFIDSRGGSGNDSSLLNVAATTGIVGFFAFCLLLGTLFFQAAKAYSIQNPWGIIVLAGLAGIIVHSFFTNTLFYPFILIWIVLAAVRLNNK